jgi:hypothetical protein
MTTTARETRIALVRARFEDIPDIDLGTAGYLLSGLDDLFALEWMIEHPASRFELDEAPSPVVHTLGLNSPMEVLLWASGGLGLVHQAVRLFERIHVARGVKVRADLVVEAGRLLIEQLPNEKVMDPKITAAIKRASETLAVLESLRIVDDDETA